MKLSLKKSKVNDAKSKNVGQDTKKSSDSQDIMVIDDSFDRLMAQYSNNVSLIFVKILLLLKKLLIKK